MKNRLALVLALAAAGAAPTLARQPALDFPGDWTATSEVTSRVQGGMCLGDAAPTGASSSKTPPAKLGRLAWLSGNWIGTLGSAALEERWTPATGGSMLATSRTLRNGRVTEFEYLCIAERAGSLVYTAMPNGRTPATDFMLTAIDDTSATFENPSHDFPKMIRYALRPDGALDATISGGAGTRATTFTFRKAQ